MRDLIGERAAQLAANRAKPIRPFVPTPVSLPVSTPCRGALDPVYRRSLWLTGKKLWADHGFSEEEFKAHIREYNAKLNAKANG
jgi:hypothetical protein